MKFAETVFAVIGTVLLMGLTLIFTGGLLGIVAGVAYTTFQWFQ